MTRGDLKEEYSEKIRSIHRHMSTTKIVETHYIFMKMS